MQTREPPTLVGASWRPLLERHEGGEKATYTGHSSSLFVQRGHYGAVGDLGMGQDTWQGETAGQALGNSLLKSAVTPAALSFREAGKGRTGPDALEV